MKKWLYLVIASVCVLGFVVIGCAKPAEKIRYKMGTTSSRSSLYVSATTFAKIVNKYVPEVEVSVVETGATHDNLVKTRAGMLDFGWCTSYDGSCMAYSGTMREEYKKAGPYKELRTGPGYVASATYYVIVDEGPYKKIKKLEDLEGVKFSAGIKGSATEFAAHLILDALGITPKWTPGSYGDMIAAAKDLELAGVVKWTAHIQLDSSLLDLQSRRKVKILSFTEDQLKTALKTVPGMVSFRVPAGAITALPEHPAITTYGMVVGPNLTTKMPQDIVYKMTKALCEHWDEFIAAYKSSKPWKPIEDELKYWSEIAEITTVPPFHAGMVQYFEEQGYKVPAKLIPPEYKK